jgi:ATP-binding cassette, subfamily B, bacterial CvaB/MchF/RaxB
LLEPSIIEACHRQAAIHDDIVEMPMGYETLVGDHGSGLSGGEVQRVLQARPLHKQPRMLVLDNATAHLDAETEQVRQPNDPRAEAHTHRRRETIEMADRAIVGDAGRIVHDNSGLRGATTQNRLAA